jgi:hypothetical protein
MMPFFQVEPDLAAKETRMITLFEQQGNIPPGSYGLIELYCPDPDCDCRRVIINIVEKQHPATFLASIGYSFDRDEPDAGPYLDPLNDQCAYADDLLRMVKEIVLRDRRYVARLERHYATVKRAAADPTHPAYALLREAAESEEGWMSVQEMDAMLGKRVSGPPPRDVGRNDPCPCGSGKKYKHCCMRKGRRIKIRWERPDKRAGELVDTLVRATDWPSPQLLSDILDCGDAAIEPLIDIIRAPEVHWDDRREAPSYAFKIALGLLGDLRAEAAIADLVELFYCDYLGYTLERVVHTLARIGPAVVEPVKAVAMDRTLAWYPRSLAASVLVVRVYMDPPRSQALLAYVRDLVHHGPVEGPEDRIFYTMLAQDLADLQGMEALDVIQAAYARDAIDEDYVDWPDAEAICRNPAPDLLALYTGDFFDPSDK